MTARDPVPDLPRAREGGVAPAALEPRRILASLPPLTREAAWRTAAIAATVLGVALRLLFYAERRPLWMDEVMLSTSIAWRSYGGLTQPLEYRQTAPLGFLWGARLATQLGGVSEWTLRLLPLVCGLALLPLLWAAGLRLLGKREALAALVLAALSQPLIYYAAEVKQYSGDACVTAALLFFAAGVLRAPAARGAWLRLAAAGAVALVFSQPAVFTLAAIGVALLVAPSVRRVPGWLRRVVPLGALWGALFLLLYATVYRASATSAYMQRVWQETFLTPSAPDFAARLYLAARYALVQSLLPVWPDPPRALVLGASGVFLAGVVALWRRDRGVAALVTLPFLFVMLASAMERYPAAIRVLLFLCPLVFLVYAAALAAAVDLLPARARGVAFVAAVAAFVYWRQGPVRENAVRPRRYEDTRDVIAEYLRRESPDPVYVYADGIPSWAFYTTDWRAPDTARLAWMATRGDREEDEPVRATRDGARLELLGRGPGIEWRERRGNLQAGPAAGWEAHEARRIHDLAARGASGRYVWVYLSHFGETEHDALLAAVRAEGGRVVLAHTEDTAALYHVRFEGAASGAPSPSASPLRSP